MRYLAGGVDYVRACPYIWTEASNKPPNRFIFIRSNDDPASNRCGIFIDSVIKEQEVNCDHIKRPAGWIVGVSRWSYQQCDHADSPEPTAF